MGAKDRGTRFLSFVDTMLGYRHLLTTDDLNKAASMCSCLKGVLRSRFLVLSDDRDPPPPPPRGKRSHPDDDSTSTARIKRFQTRAQINSQRGVPDRTRLPSSSQAAPVGVVAHVTTQPGSISNPSQPSPHPSQAMNIVQGNQPHGLSANVTQVQTIVTSEQVVAWQQAAQDEIHVLSVDQQNTSTPFAPVKSRRARRLPAGVKVITRPTRTTPDRQAKASRVPVVQAPDPDAIDLDIEVEASPTGSGDMDASSGSSTSTVLDWVRFY